MEKHIIDLFDATDLEKVKKIQQELFKSEPIKTKTQVDPIAIGLSLLSNPKKLKKILFTIGITSVIGTGTIIYLLTKGIILLVNYI